MRKPDSALLHPAAGILATLTLFTLFAGDFWRDLIGWPAYLALVGALTVGNLTWLFITRPKLSFRKWPKLLLLFVALAIASIGWARYTGVHGQPGGHVDVTLGVVALMAAAAGGLVPALILDPRQLLSVLGAALRWIIGLSMLFELVVSVVIRHPILPIAHLAGVDYAKAHLPASYYWSRNLLFHGGQIQGIVGNGDLLAMIALVGLIVFGIQRAEGQSRPFWGTFWIALAAVELVLARSATVWVATVGVFVALGFALWARRIGQVGRGKLYGTGVALLVIAVAGVVFGRHELTHLLGKSATLTGRTDIWAKVIPLAQQHPVFGWGWLGYWVPWATPFDGLAVRGGVEYLQAHNAWLDLWLQLGVVGAVVFGLLVLTTLGRSWFLAVDRPVTDARTEHPFSAITLLPLLVLSAQLVQSFAESRMLLESGLAMLVMWAVLTKKQRP